MSVTTEVQKRPPLAINTDPQTRYRSEIDGLRAIAVLAVILNHFNRSLAPLGYLGVDIFFVISGYVITASIYNRDHHKLFRFWGDFYSRRFKRLFPALAVCVLLASAFISMVDPEPTASLRTGLSSLFGFSNLYLFKEATDYFGTWADLNVFTHTWSLGVEEQFYLIFPLALWATRFRIRPARQFGAFNVLVGLTSATSLIFFIFISGVNQAFSFFMLPARLWELGAGALVFSAAAPGSSIFKMARSLPCSVILAELVTLIFLPLRAEALATIVTVALSAILITGIRGGTLTYRVLTLPIMSYIGKISYSLYLWHWVVICLSRWTVGLSWRMAPIQLGLMFALAAASFHMLEAPLRRRKWSRSGLWSFLRGLGALLTVAGATACLLGPGHKLLFLGSRQVAPADARPSPPISSPKGTLLLVGDSHAGHFAEMAADIAARRGLRLVVISNGATPFPAVPISSPVGGLTIEKNRKSTAVMEHDLQAVLGSFTRNGQNTIVLSSFYRFYFEPLIGSRKYQEITHYDSQGRVISAEKSLENWLAALKEFADRNRQTRIVVILSTPEMPNIYPLALCKREWFRPDPSDACVVGVDRRATVKMLDRLNTRIRQAVALSPNVSVLDPTPYLCPPNQSVCRSEGMEGRLFSDEDHLTPSGARRIEAPLFSVLASNSD